MYLPRSDDLTTAKQNATKSYTNFKGRNVSYTIDSRYIVVIYDAIVHIAQQLQLQNCTHERYLIPRPYRRSMGCLSWVRVKKKERDISRAHCNTTNRQLLCMWHFLPTWWMVWAAATRNETSIKTLCPDATYCRYLKKSIVVHVFS